MNKVHLSRAAALVKSNPVLLAKINSLHAGIQTDLRRNKPSRAAITALTHQELAASCNTPATSLSRFLDKHGIGGDIHVGNRFVFSKPHASKIGEAVFYSNLASEMAFCAKTFEESRPSDSVAAWDLSLKNRAKSEEIIKSIPKSRK